MPLSDRRGALLHDLDHYARDLRGGDPDADATLEALIGLAPAIVGAIAGWRARLSQIGAALDRERAACLILETVFDEVLSPQAWRALAAAVALEANRA